MATSKNPKKNPAEEKKAAEAAAQNEPAVNALYASKIDAIKDIIFGEDNAEALRAAGDLARICNLFGYGEIKPPVSYQRDSTMLELFERLDARNFRAAEIVRKEDIWPSFKGLLSRERQDEEPAA